MFCKHFFQKREQKNVKFKEEQQDKQNVEHII